MQVCDTHVSGNKQQTDLLIPIPLPLRISPARSGLPVCPHSSPTFCFCYSLAFFGCFLTFKYFFRGLAYSDPLGVSFSVSATNTLIRNHREVGL